MKNRTLFRAVLPIVVLLTFMLAGCGSDNTPTPSPTAWKTTWVSPTPQGNSLRGVWASSNSSIYAVGAQGAILHSDGTTWRVMESPVRSSLSAIWGTSDSNVYAVGEYGVILRYDGKRWQIVRQASSTSADDLMSIWGLSDKLVFIGGRGRVLKYDGSQWSETAAAGLEGSYVNGLWGSAADNLYAAGNNAIYRYNGSSWQNVYEDTSGRAVVFTSIWGSAADDIYVGMKLLAGASELEYVMMHFDGTAWKPVTDSAFYSGSYIYAVTGTDRNNVFAMGLQSNIYHFDGSSWKWMLGGAQLNLSGASASPTGTVVAVGELGVIYRYTEADWNFERSESFDTLQGSWSTGSKAYIGGDQGIFMFDGVQMMPQELPEYDGVFSYSGFWGFSDKAVYAVAAGAIDEDDARIVLGFDGAAWSVLLNELGDGLQAIWGTSPSNLYAVGNKGVILQYNGADWNRMTSPVDSPLYSIWGAAADNIYAVGNDGTFIKYDGKAWSKVPVNLNTQLLSVNGTGPDNILVVGGQGTVLHYNGTTWRTVASGADARYNGIVWISPQSALIVGDGGKVAAWDGVGVTSVEQIATSTLHSAFLLGSKPFAVGNYGTVLRFSR